MTVLPSQSYQVRLVGPAVWRPVVEEWFQKLSAQEARLAGAILSGLHSRHVGITPRLAASLTQAVLSPSSRRYQAPWKSIMETLRAVLRDLSDVSDALPQDRAVGEHGVVFGAGLSYTVFHIAQPIIEAACQYYLYETLLFCAEDPETAVSPKDYRIYQDRLWDAVQKVVYNPSNDLPLLFWKERAVMLESLTYRCFDDEHRVLPATDLPDMGIFLNLKPDTGFSRQQDHRKLQMPDRQRLRERRLAEVGADGIRLTTRLEDLNHMLMSEHLYPELIHLDRLLNSGYWVIKRPPRPITLRHTLIVGLCPGVMLNLPASVLIKTCWFDFVLRFSHLLRSSGLDQSEFRWIEGDKFLWAREKSMLLKDMPRIPAPLSEQNRGAYRHLFLKALGWLPAFLDSHAYYKPLPDHILAEAIEGGPRHTARSQPGVTVAQAWISVLPAETSDSPDSSSAELQAFSLESDLDDVESPPLLRYAVISLIIENRTDQVERLVKVEVDPGVAAAVEIHRAPFSAGSSQHPAPLETVDLPAHSFVEFALGGLYLLLVDLQNDLREGEYVPLTLTLESGQELYESARVGQPELLAQFADTQLPEELLIKAWLRAALVSRLDDSRWHEENRQWSETSEPRPSRSAHVSGRLNLEQFQYVHLMIFLPERFNHSGSALTVQTIQSTLRLPANTHLSITWIPDQIDNAEHWGFEGVVRWPQTRIAGSQRFSTDRLAGTLIKTWLDNLTKEIGSV